MFWQMRLEELMLAAHANAFYRVQEDRQPQEHRGHRALSRLRLLPKQVQ